MGILLIGLGACLLYVAAQGVETASASGVYDTLVSGLRGSRTESGTNLSGEGGDASAERPNTGEDGMDGLVGLQR